jgi:hypothetical protein
VLTEDLPSVGLAWPRSRLARPYQSAAEISCREAGHYQACRQAGEQASPDHGDSRDRSTAKPIHHRQARMCWLRAAFAAGPAGSGPPLLLDRSALYGVLAEIEGLGLDVLEVCQSASF